MTIAEVSNKYNITKDTLRYYEKIGLLTNVPRSSSKIRNYDQNTCKQIEFIKCMRDAGVEIDVLKEYMKQLSQGKTTVNTRKELLEKQHQKLIEKRKQLDETINKLNYKIKLYEEISQGKRKDFTETGG